MWRKRSKKQICPPCHHHGFRALSNSPISPILGGTHDGVNDHIWCPLWRGWVMGAYCQKECGVFAAKKSDKNQIKQIYPLPIDFINTIMRMNVKPTWLWCGIKNCRNACAGYGSEQWTCCGCRSSDYYYCDYHLLSLLLFSHSCDLGERLVDL